MDVANSSMYDGMTSFAEACILAFSQTKKNKIVVSKGLHYQALQVLHTYAKTRKEFEVVEIDLDGTVTDLKKLEAAVDDAEEPFSYTSTFTVQLKILKRFKALLKIKKHYLSYMQIH